MEVPMQKLIGGLIAGIVAAAPLSAQVPRIPQAPLPPATAPIAHHCPDDSGCPFPGAIVPEHTNAAPAYPAALQQAGVSGTVRLRFVVTSQGMVEPGSVRVMAGSHAELGAAAAQTVQGWEFHLLGSSRRASSVPVRLTITYALSSPCSGTGTTAEWAADRRNPRMVVTGCSSAATRTAASP
jgi:TonB family protein